jgi:hypothetical protein
MPTLVTLLITVLVPGLLVLITGRMVTWVMVLMIVPILGVGRRPVVGSKALSSLGKLAFRVGQPVHRPVQPLCRPPRRGIQRKLHPGARARHISPNGLYRTTEHLVRQATDHEQARIGG